MYLQLDNLYAPICDQAQEHIHADECILIYGHSLMVESFLKAAARKRRFQVCATVFVRILIYTCLLC